MGKKIKKDEIIKIAAQNIKEARNHLSMVQHLAERDLGGTPKTINGFKELLSENLLERIHGLDVIIDALNGNNREAKLDANVLEDSALILRDLGQFLAYLKESGESDIPINSPNILIDSICILARGQIRDYNEMVDKLNDIFFGLKLCRIRED